MAKVRLTKKRAKWAAPRNATLKGTPLSYPAAPAARYEKSLDVLIRDMRADYQREILRLFRTVAQDGQITMDANLGSQARILFSALGKKWAKLFAQRSTAITERMVASVDKHSMHSLGESLRTISGGLTIKVPAMPAGMADVLKATVAENVALISSISTQYQERIEGAVYRSIQQGGRGAADVYDEVIKIGGMSERRAHLIATDQTRKATSAFNRERAKSVGIRKGIWRHSGGSGEPRKKHVDFDGHEFDLDEPPAIGDKGQRVMPGEEIACKCYWTPILADFDSL